MKRKEEKQPSAVLRSAKDCAYIATFVAVTICTQLALSAIAGVELVTVLFVTFAFTFGLVRGLAAATAFSLLRQLVFGVDLKTLVLYLVYYNCLCLVFALLGKNKKEPEKRLLWLVGIACVCTVSFTLLDNVFTPIWYAYTQKAAWLYFWYSLPVMLPQTLCTAVSVSVLFLPLYKIFRRLR